MIKFRDCAVESLLRMCGNYTLPGSTTPAVSNYWIQANNQSLKTMTGSTNPDCEKHKITDKITGSLLHMYTYKIIYV